MGCWVLQSYADRIPWAQVFGNLKAVLNSHLEQIPVESVSEDGTFPLLLLVVTSQSNALTAILSDSDLTSSLRVLHLNALKMNCYILVRLVEAFETESGKTNLVGLDSKGKVGVLYLFTRCLLLSSFFLINLLLWNLINFSFTVLLSDSSNAS